MSSEKRGVKGKSHSFQVFLDGRSWGIAVGELFIIRNTARSSFYSAFRHENQDSVN